MKNDFTTETQKKTLFIFQNLETENFVLSLFIFGKTWFCTAKKLQQETSE